MINLIIVIIICISGLFFVVYNPDWMIDGMFIIICMIIPAIMLLTALYPIDHEQKCLDKPTEQVVLEIKYNPYRLTLLKEEK